MNRDPIKTLGSFGTQGEGRESGLIGAATKMYEPVDEYGNSKGIGTRGPKQVHSYKCTGIAYRAIFSHGANAFTVGGFGFTLFSLLCINGLLSLLSVNSVCSLLSMNSIFSIGSINSVFAYRCINEHFKVCIS